MLSGMLVLQKHKELVFWLNLQYEQKVIFIKILSSKEKIDYFLPDVLL